MRDARRCGLVKAVHGESGALVGERRVEGGGGKAGPRLLGRSEESWRSTACGAVGVTSFDARAVFVVSGGVVSVAWCTRSPQQPPLLGIGHSRPLLRIGPNYSHNL